MEQYLNNVLDRNAENLNFLTKPHPVNGELFSNYLHRLAVANDIEPYAIWNRFRHSKLNRIRPAYEPMLDRIPQTVIDLDQFAASCSRSVFEFEEMSFLTVIRKIISDDECFDYSSRIYSLRGIPVRQLRYCPFCLAKSTRFQLIWQISELGHCATHNQPLVSTCPKCRHVIPYYNKNINTNRCFRCDSLLGKDETTCDSSGQNLQHVRLFEDWSYLLDSTNPPLAKQTANQTISQHLATKLLYVVSGGAVTFDIKAIPEAILSPRYSR